MSTIVAARVFTPTHRVYRTPKTISRSRDVRVRSSNDLVESSRILGEAITAGVIFYTSLQWAHFRRIRLHAEEAQKAEETKKDERKKRDAERKKTEDPHWKE